MNRAVIALLSVVCASAVVKADKVTFLNNSNHQLIVRCIAPGNVSVPNEFFQKIGPKKTHSRDNFASGLRVVAVWTADLKHCVALPITIKDGLTLPIAFDEQLSQLIIEAPCSGCAAGSSEDLP